MIQIKSIDKIKYLRDNNYEIYDRKNYKKN